MKILLILLMSFSALGSDLYKLGFKKPSGEEISFNQYKGSTLLIVNIATRCGYTGQLDGLEKLYKRYKSKGFTIIGIPSNDFGGQSPESNKEIVKFCRAKFGASFPISQKAIVKGDKKNALYTYLTNRSNKQEIRWNFTKFLISKKGKILKRYPSNVAPEDKSFQKDIESAL
jgi:glutathione peroxidase